MIKKENLQNLCSADAEPYLEPIRDACEKYSINTPLRFAHFLAQILHETGGLRWPREIWGPTAAQTRYEGRKDLGNVETGDGERYKGRGLIHLTGRYNYTLASNEIGVDFVTNPQLLEQPQYAALVAGWYWNRHNLNDLADKDDTVAITKAVNGGLNGLEDREKRLRAAKVEIMMGGILQTALDKKPSESFTKVNTVVEHSVLGSSHPRETITRGPTFVRISGDRVDIRYE